MPRRKVDFKKGEYYHIYNRGNNRDQIFFETENYLYFEKKMRWYFSPEVCDLVAYCLMPNHFHFLVKLNFNDFADSMKSLCLTYSKAINKRMNRTGSLFEGRFHAIHLDNEEYLVYLSKYIHRNPVEAKLVVDPQDWEFSSFHDYMEFNDDCLIKPQNILKLFDSSDDYRRFVLTTNKNEFKTIEHILID